MLPLVKKLGAKKMEKEKLEVESSEEDVKVLPEEKKEDIKSEEEGTQVKKEESEKSEDEFEKKEEFVSTNKFNQAVRKQRELELEKRELEKRLAEKEGSDVVADKVKPAPKKEESDSFFEDIEDEEKVVTKKEEEIPSIDASKLIDEKLKPVFDTLKKREEEDRKKSRTAFFESHPEYLTDSEKWNGLLDELNNSINPNSQDDYFTQLNKAHILYTGQKVEDVEIVSKQKEMASESSGGSGAIKATAKEEFTAEDRKYMKEWGISEDGMRAYKEKTKSGAMRILT